MIATVLLAGQDCGVLGQAGADEMRSARAKLAASRRSISPIWRTCRL